MYRLYPLLKNSIHQLVFDKRFDMSTRYLKTVLVYRCFRGSKGGTGRTLFRRAKPPPRTVVRRVEPSRQRPPPPREKKSSAFDCFKRKPKPPEGLKLFYRKTVLDTVL